MKIYGDGSIVEVAIPLLTERGESFSPNTLTYRVLDEAGAELVASSALAYGGETEMIVIVGAVSNTLGAGETRMMRVVELTAITDEGIIVVESRYVIESITYLSVGDNSFQTYNEALLIEMDLIGVETWETAPAHKKKAALIEAYDSICKLTFRIGDRQDSLFPNSANVNIKYLTASEIAALDARMLLAIRKAQVIEADVVLGGDPIAEKRKTGLMSETIGESSNMFRPGKPLVLPVSNRALHYLAPYITMRKVVGRG